MISMARTFGAPESVPAGKQARSASTAVSSGLQLAFNGAHDVHHVAVALDEHQLVDLYAAEAAHSAHIVASQINEHHVFGTLLLVM